MAFRASGAELADALGMVGMDSQVESGTSVCLSILRRARLEKGSGCLFVRRLIATASPLNPTIVERGGRFHT